MLAAMREWRYPPHFSRHVMHEDVCRCNGRVADRTDSGAFYPATIDWSRLASQSLSASPF
jgi:hypothetical protein